MLPESLATDIGNFHSRAESPPICVVPHRGITVEALVTTDGDTAFSDDDLQPVTFGPVGFLVRCLAVALVCGLVGLAIGEAVPLSALEDSDTPSGYALVGP